jgi:hypothetical protein
MSQHRADGKPRRWGRKQLLAFVGTGVAALAGIGFAAGWVSIPNGTNGHAYGHGKGATPGQALQSVVVSTTDPQYAIGPAETGDSILIRVYNPNTVPAVVTSVVQQPGTTLVKVGDPTCTSPVLTIASSPNNDQVVLHDLVNNGPGGLGSIAGGASIDLALTLDTGPNLPSCLINSEFDLSPLTITAHN